MPYKRGGTGGPGRPGLYPDAKKIVVRITPRDAETLAQNGHTPTIALRELARIMREEAEARDAR